MRFARYHLGLPIWSHAPWVGELFERGTRQRDFLAQYAGVFDTVEGNTTFHHVPDAAALRRWREATPKDFRFCLKFPRTITHDLKLRGAGLETRAFLDAVSGLEERLGPFLVQLPPSLDDGEHIARFLKTLPKDYRYTVELRAPTLNGGWPAEQALEETLAELEMDRAFMDTRPLRESKASDPLVIEAQRRKPDLPVPTKALGRHPTLRYVAHPEAEGNEAWLAKWAERVALWIDEGREPYVFVHSPDELYAPRLARRFHELLSARLELPAMPKWPAADQPGQMNLF